MKLFRDYAVLATGQLAGKVAGFIAFAWLARALGPAEYGAVEYVVGLSMVFGAVVEGGFGIIAVRRAAHAPDTLAVLAAQIPWARLALALLSMPLMVAIAMVLGHRDVPFALAALFALALLAIPWRQEWLLQAHERMADAAWVQLLRAIVFTGLVVWWVHGSGSTAWVGAAELASALIATAYCMAAQHRHVVPLRLRAPRQGARALIDEGFVVGLGGIVFTVQQYAPLFVAPALAGPDATAWFAAAARVTTSLLVFSFLYHYSLYPSVTRALGRGGDDLGKLLAASFRVTTWLGVLAALALMLLAKPVVAVTFGATMAPAAGALAVLAWTLPVAVCSGHARWALAARGAQRAVLQAQVAGLIGTVVVALAAGRALGAPGLGVASLVGALCGWGVAHWQARQRGLAVPSPAPLLAPLVLAALVTAAIGALHVHGWWTLAGALVFALLAAVLDRQLLPALRTLARAKADIGTAVPQASQQD